MNLQQQKARNLYFQTDMTQTDIADIIGVSDQTVYRWIKQNNWKQMKEAARQAPIAIVEMFYKQLYALNSSICNRDEPIPTLQESEINRKLINSIDKLKKQASLSENIQVLMGFTGFLNRIDNELAKTVVLHADRYLKEKGYTTFGFDEETEEQQTEEVIETAPPHAEQPQPNNIAQPGTIKEDLTAQPKPQSITEPQIEPPLPTADHTDKKEKAPQPIKLPRIRRKQLSQKEQERLIAQQQIRNAFYEEMYRSANTNNKSRW